MTTQRLQLLAPKELRRVLPTRAVLAAMQTAIRDGEITEDVALRILVRMAEGRYAGKAHRRIDLTGRRFGKLVVSHYSGTEAGKAKWLCDCDCGQEAVVKAACLLRGHTKSCGCYARHVHSLQSQRKWNVPPRIRRAS
ncbi:MAG: hypothetical protein ACRDRL_25900 [Sciscionella sp.]